MDTHILTRHERRRQQTRQRLIQAAVELFLEKGYADVNIQMITEKVDLGRGTFYIHFKDKEDILWSSIKDLILDLEKKAHDELEGKVLVDKEYYGLINIFDHAGHNRDLYRIIFGEKGSSAVMGKMQNLLSEMFLRDTRRARRNPEVKATIPEDILAQALTGIISRLMFWWLETPNDYSAGQMAAYTYRVIYHRAPFEPA